MTLTSNAHLVKEVLFRSHCVVDDISNYLLNDRGRSVSHAWRTTIRHNIAIADSGNAVSTAGQFTGDYRGISDPERPDLQATIVQS